MTAQNTASDPIELLKQDHAKVKQLFARFEATEDDAEKKQIFAEVTKELQVHTEIEEKIFYPAVKKLPDMSSDIAEAVEEHNLVDHMIAETKKARPGETYDARFTVLMENVKHHIKEEEEEMFPEISGKLPDQDKLAAKMVAMKEKLTAEQKPAPRSKTAAASSSRSRTTAASKK